MSLAADVSFGGKDEQTGIRLVPDAHDGGLTPARLSRPAGTAGEHGHAGV
jgi:hypothetical protein